MLWNGCLSVCLSLCLSVCDVGVLWPNSWMVKMKLVGLGPGDIVFDGDPAPPKRKGGGAQHSQFWPMSVVAKRMDGSRCHTWYGIALGPRDRWGPCLLLQRGTALHFSAHILLWPNGWMDEHATWYGGKLRPRRHCVRIGSSSPDKGTAPLHFLSMSIVTKRLD